MPADAYLDYFQRSENVSLLVLIMASFYRRKKEWKNHSFLVDFYVEIGEIYLAYNLFVLYQQRRSTSLLLNIELTQKKERFVSTVFIVGTYFKSKLLIFYSQVAAAIVLPLWPV